MFSILNMSSAATRRPPPDDLTAPARIRNAAIAHLARDGFQKANLRAIAAEAGVSVGLIFHHFGSKDGLLRACDEHVLSTLTGHARTAGRAAGSGLPDLQRAYMSDPETYGVQARYMARAMAEDTPAAGRFADALVEESERIFRDGAADGTMRPSSDPRALAVLNLLLSQAMLTMPPPLARALGAERFGPDVLARVAVPAMELFTHGVYTSDAALRAARDAWATGREE